MYDDYGFYRTTVLERHYRQEAARLRTDLAQAKAALEDEHGKHIDTLKVRDALLAERKRLIEKEGRQFGENLRLGAEVFGLRRKVVTLRNNLEAACALIGADKVMAYQAAKAKSEAA